MCVDFECLRHIGKLKWFVFVSIDILQAEELKCVLKVSCWYIFGSARALV